MKHNERKLLSRYLGTIHDVPLAAGGATSGSIGGMGKTMKDVGEYRRLSCNFIYALLMSDVDDDMEDHDPEKELDALTDWIALRESENWG